MLIAEELFLLLRRDDGKAESATAQNGYGLAAAVVTDLVLAERITLSDDKDPRMTVTAPHPTGHPVLDAALERLCDRDGKKLSSLVTDGRLAAVEPVALALRDAGVVDIEEKRALGLVPAKYPVRDPEPERRVRERLRTVLAGGTPQPADATLLAILQGLGIAAKVLEDEAGGLGRKELKARIEDVATHVQAGTAVARAVEAMNTAIMTAAIVPVIISTTGS
ncbi:GPP34 family phosphoprotein [Nocardioides sp. zg-1308]|uniref:GOLPH3/VPS74 family protein n=1 Tax=Nocardioides TaxID=1839 RepID=UPI0015527EA6|nr:MULTISPECIES: GPP34 family phosphoprotein [unclassified Nocardioides]NPD06614.1 GPP34 family phosphoprotein [Nocardioides sp. zg-1308]WQQ23926.1 GPP34 family phosphoprotein [Nocardioides sp. S-34]